MLKLNKLIALDLETTGLNKNKLNKKIDFNHFIIEIGAVEIINRNLTNNYFHTYLKPPRLIDLEAFKIHKISDDFLINKPIFKNKLKELFTFIKNSTLIIHNANFDLSFLNKEIKLINSNFNFLQKKYKIIDTLFIAKKKFPTKSNTLQSLAKRLDIKCNNFYFHNALIDAIILAKIYLELTNVQKKYLDFHIQNVNIFKDIKIFDNYEYQKLNNSNFINKKYKKKYSLEKISINDIELKEHNSIINYILTKNNNCLWKL